MMNLLMIDEVLTISQNIKMAIKIALMQKNEYTCKLQKKGIASFS